MAERDDPITGKLFGKISTRENSLDSRKLAWNFVYKAMGIFIERLKQKLELPLTLYEEDPVTLIINQLNTIFLSIYRNHFHRNLNIYA